LGRTVEKGKKSNFVLLRLGEALSRNVKKKVGVKRESDSGTSLKSGNQRKETLPDASTNLLSSRLSSREGKRKNISIRWSARRSKSDPTTGGEKILRKKKKDKQVTAFRLEAQLERRQGG